MCVFCEILTTKIWKHGFERKIFVDSQINALKIEFNFRKLLFI